ncbi:MAG: hypothetical protein CME62_12370 [Halobacteriovoraceae bacterium]|nr:hypothetical protein [Halobacteriovoraceae bacterium]|tara:strand:- start:891 stop:2240 length:1350 start_codon:yes stop_codon:yes gene_type:complete
MKIALWILLIASSVVNAATIAVIDSGVDVEHKDLLTNLWMNEGEIADNGRDEDRNGYQDDVYGWNFAEGNNLVIDRKYVGTFSDDPYKFFEIQGKSFLGQASAEEKEWVQAKRKDKKFLAEMQKFGNFVHGTHVAGITVDNNREGQILSVKLIPTEVKPFIASLSQKNKNAEDKNLRWKILTKALSALADQQMTLLTEIAHYVGTHKADIANGSFGTGFKQAKMITNIAYKAVFFKDPSKEDSDKAAKIFLNALIKSGKKMVDAAPNTLFVFAAGNDGSNNDEFPTSPTNIQADNVISVAATYKYEFIAPFSNYGIKMVDVAAPGMLINSQIPGDEYLKVSGTSQAAPYVANIAAQIKDINPELAPKDIKAIIMGTVDAKKFLSDKVKAAGIVNMNRATHAAKLTFNMGVSEAISQAQQSISDVRVDSTKSLKFPQAVTPLPLTNQFTL